MMPRSDRSWSLMLAGLAMAAVSCSLGGRVIEETGIAPAPETPTEPVLGSRFPPAKIENDEGGPVVLPGQVPYTIPFFTWGLPEPIVILEDQGGFVVRD